MTVIRSKTRIVLSRAARLRLPPKKRRAAIQNAKTLTAHRLLYNSGKHAVVAFIVQPRGSRSLLPCIIWNRGGSDEFGVLNDEHLFSGWLAEFAKSGYLVIASQYSGSAGSGGRDQYGGSEVRDILNLYQVLGDTPRADRNRIGMYGASRGGMMAFLALARVSWLKALAVKAPLTNLIRQLKRRPKLKQLFRRSFGISVSALKKRSVVYWVDKLHSGIPVLMQHGTADWRVSVLDTLDLARILYERRIPYRLDIYEGDDHSLTLHDAEARAVTIGWFDRFVKNTKPAPDLKKFGS